jgi:hypothetical protein
MWGICSLSYMWGICFPSYMWGISFSHMWKTLAWLHYFNKRGGLVPRNSVTLHIVIEVPVPTQESMWSIIYVFGVTTLPFSTIVLLDFATVPIVLHLLLLFLFHFIADLLPSITHFLAWSMFFGESLTVTALIKTSISNLLRAARLWNNLHTVRSY